MTSYNLIWSPGVTLADLEQQAIMKALSFYRGNQTTTATALGISRKTLGDKLKQYREDDESQKQADEARRKNREYWLNRSRGITTGAAAPVPRSDMAPPVSKVKDPLGIEPDGVEPELLQDDPKPKPQKKRARA